MSREQVGAGAFPAVRAGVWLVWPLTAYGGVKLAFLLLSAT